jgi:hypothetical protein
MHESGHDQTTLAAVGRHVGVWLTVSLLAACCLYVVASWVILTILISPERKPH